MSPVLRCAAQHALLISALSGCIGSSVKALDCHAAEDKLGPYTPDYVKIQAGGYLGLFTLGAGYLLLNSHLDLAGYYGWVPPVLAGKSIHGLTLRAAGRATGACLAPNLNWVYAYGGLSALFTFGEGFFMRVPERFHDDSYYRRTALRWLFHLGSEVELTDHSRRWGMAGHAAYAELTALDDYIGVWFQNRGSVRFRSMFSPSFGYRARF